MVKPSDLSISNSIGWIFSAKVSGILVFWYERGVGVNGRKLFTEWTWCVLVCAPEYGPYLTVVLINHVYIESTGQDRRACRICAPLKLLGVPFPEERKRKKN
jgi:hypothetical protein